MAAVYMMALLPLMWLGILTILETTFNLPMEVE